MDEVGQLVECDGMTVLEEVMNPAVQEALAQFDTVVFQRLTGVIR